MVLATSGHVLFAQQTSPVEAKLVVPDTKVLPGVPFDMWIEVRNSSDSTVTVSLFPVLVVRPVGGDIFEIRPNPDGPPVLLKGSRREGERPVESLILAPGEKKTLTLPIQEGLQAAEYFSDPRLSPPGRYTLSMRLDSFPEGGVRGGRMAEVTFRGAVVTSEVAVERIQPAGADAKVWQRMQEVAEGGRWSQDCMVMTFTSGRRLQCVSEEGPYIFREVLTKYPDSNYVPYAFLTDAGFGDSEVQSVLAAIDRFPASPVIELLHLKALRLLVTRSASMSEAYEREAAMVKQSKRPTTRIRAFGREDLPKEPCLPEDDCKE